MYEKIPLSNIEKIAIVVGNNRTLASVKKSTGCDYIINGGLYTMKTMKPVCHLKADGKVLSSEDWSTFGYVWDQGPDISMAIVPGDNKKLNHISCVALLTPYSGLDAKLTYDKALGGRRGRTAIALTKDSLILYCSKDGGSEAKTPEQLRLGLANIGATTALMMDSRGSSQCDFAGKRKVTSSRRVHNYICVWTKKAATPPATSTSTPVTSTGSKYKVHVYNAKGRPSTLNIRSGPGTIYKKLGYYRNGTVITVLNTKGKWSRTSAGWVCSSYLKKQ